MGVVDDLALRFRLKVFSDFVSSFVSGVFVSDIRAAGILIEGDHLEGDDLVGQTRAVHVL